MSPGRAIQFSITVLIVAATIALSSQTGPDSPRARAAVWLRAHGYPEVADFIEPSTSAPLIEIVPRLP